MVLLYEDVYGHKHNKTPNTTSVNENTIAFISVISSKSVFRNRIKGFGWGKGNRIEEEKKRWVQSTTDFELKSKEKRWKQTKKSGKKGR